MVWLVEETLMLPKIEELQFDGKLIGSLPDIKAKLAQMPFYMSRIVDDQLILARVESRNIKKMPYLFHMIIFKNNTVSVVYSTPPDTSVDLRRAFVIKNLASVMSITEGLYQINQSKFLQYIDSVIDGILNGLSQNYNILYNKYDSLLFEYRELKRLNLELSASNRNLTIQTSQLNEESKVFKEQLEQLKKYSDSALMALVEEWIEVHSNSIDLNEFANANAVTIPRVEQVLDKMVSMGYLELKG